MRDDFEFELSLLPCCNDLGAKFSPCELHINVRMRKDLYKKTCFEFYLYDESRTLMGCKIQEEDPEDFFYRNKLLTTNMPIYHVWTKGEYRLLMHCWKDGERDKPKAWLANFTIDVGEPYTCDDAKIEITGMQQTDDIFSLKPLTRSYKPLMMLTDDFFYTMTDVLRSLTWRVRNMGLDFSNGGMVRLYYVVETSFRKGEKWNATRIEHYTDDCIRPLYGERMESHDGEESYTEEEDFTLLQPEDLPDEPPEEEEPEEEPTEENAGAGEVDDEFERMLNDFINDMKSDDDDEDTDPEPDEDNDDTDGIAGLCTGGLPDEPSDVKFDILQPLADPHSELDKLVGCKEIKQRLEQFVMLSRYNSMMHSVNPGGKCHNLSLHSVFLGKPGTGKTTVCKIFGSLLKEAGVLSKGHVVMCSRRDFIGTRWGDEERVIRQAVVQAQGGVLMIDEAYQLDSGIKNDPGQLVIPLLMDILSDESRRDIAIVLCGYKDEMNHLLETNPGLRSRFPNVFEFSDFTMDELVEISRRRIREYGYEFTRAAMRKYRGVLEEAYAVRDPKTWGNARFVANLLENIYLHHAMRCVRNSEMDRRHIYQLTPSDVQPIKIAKSKPRIGF